MVLEAFNLSKIHSKSIDRFYDVLNILHNYTSLTSFDFFLFKTLKFASS
jgi:hypothetical protein